MRNMWVKCSKCKFGGNGDNTCIYGKDIKRCAESVGCVTTGKSKNEKKANERGVIYE